MVASSHVAKLSNKIYLGKGEELNDDILVRILGTRNLVGFFFSFKYY